MGRGAAGRALHRAWRFLAFVVVAGALLVAGLNLFGKQLLNAALRRALPPGWDAAVTRAGMGPDGLHLGGVELRSSLLGSVAIDGVEIVRPALVPPAAGHARGLRLGGLVLAGLRVTLRDPTATAERPEVEPAGGAGPQASAAAAPAPAHGRLRPLVIDRLRWDGCGLDLPAGAGRIESSGSVDALRVVPARSVEFGPVAVRAAAVGPLMLDGDFGPLELHGASLRIASPGGVAGGTDPVPVPVEGEASAARLRWQEYELLGLELTARGHARRLEASALRAHWLGARLEGRALLELDDAGTGLRWRWQGRARALSVARLIEQFRLAESVRAWGDWDLQVDIAGHDGRLTFLEVTGRQRPDGRGWIDVISTDALLARMGVPAVAEMQQVIRGLRDYDVEMGELRIAREQAGFRIQLRLDGPSGKRSIDLRLQAATEGQAIGSDGSEGAHDDS